MAQDAPQTGQDGPQRARDELKIPQDVPKMAPIGLKSGPRWPSDRPRWPQEGPKMASKGTKMSSRYLNLFPNRPQERKMLSTRALNVAVLPFFAHLPRKIIFFPKIRRPPPAEIDSNLFERGNGKRDADCVENQLFCTYTF